MAVQARERGSHSIWAMAKSVNGKQSMSPSASKDEAKENCSNRGNDGKFKVGRTEENSENED